MIPQTTTWAAGEVQGRRLSVRGVVQGTGFRPLVCRTARELGIRGWVANRDDGVIIEAEGSRAALDEFVRRLRGARTAHTGVATIGTARMPPAGMSTFEIRQSEATGAPVAHVAPDLAICPACLGELRDPRDRRHRYPFISCTACGPRFSILLGLPYDRPNTTMRRFPPCPRCAAEYDDPEDRRFHAQTIACAACGPRIALLDAAGGETGAGEAALEATLDALRDGAIVAVKGIGGFHLITDARSGASVGRLRTRKRRLERPFAVMYPSLEAIAADCWLSPAETRLLSSPAAPIVLVRPRRRTSLAPSVTVASREVGALLPYTPLHYLLLDGLGFPVVATSGNLSGEPLVIDESEAVSQLGGIADLFLVHDRPIARPIDDSLVRAIAGRPQVLRRARGLAPAPIPVGNLGEGCLALGGHLKNTIAIGTLGFAFMSPHIGDLDTARSFRQFRRAVADVQSLSRVDIVQTACDAHPDYLSSRHAEESKSPVTRVQHHYAHVRSVMAENGLTPPVLGVAWDGGGLGDDGTIWGGEFLEVRRTGWWRAAHLVPFALPGGETAIRQPWRVAVAVLAGAGVPVDSLRIPDDIATPERVRQVAALAADRRNPCPRTSSVGRLFDAVASIAGIRHVTSFEGQAAMELEAAVGNADSRPASYPIPLTGTDPVLIDWRPMIRRIVADLCRGATPATIASRLHFSLVRMLVEVASRVGIECVAMSGGCFQNRFLAEQAIVGLRRAGFRPYWHQEVPPNDGGLSLGQLAAAVEGA